MFLCDGLIGGPLYIRASACAEKGYLGMTGVDKVVDMHECVRVAAARVHARRNVEQFGVDGRSHPGEGGVSAEPAHHESGVRRGRAPDRPPKVLLREPCRP